MHKGRCFGCSIDHGMVYEMASILTSVTIFVRHKRLLDPYADEMQHVVIFMSIHNNQEI